MTAIHLATVNMTRGEVSPLMYSRADLDFYRASLRRCQNFNVMVQGGVERRGPLRFVGEVADSAQRSRLLPFEFNSRQTYVLEASGNGKMRFVAQAGIVESGGSPYQIDHPWTASEISAIHAIQFNDQSYLASGSRPIKILTRKGETNWTLADYAPTDGPYMPSPETETTLKPASTCHAVPRMTSNTSPSGVVSSSNGSASAYLVFDRSKETRVIFDSGSNGWIKYDFGAGNGVIVDAYSLTAPDNQNQHYDMPTQWVLQGSDDNTTWDALDSRNAETGWAGSETRYYDFRNKTAYRYYRFLASGGGGSDGISSEISRIDFHLSPLSQTPFNLTASSTDDINDGAGFQASDVGRPVRLLGTDSLWRWAEIKQYVSPTVVRIVMNGQALEDLSPIRTWQMGSWSDLAGWPRTVALFKERICADGGDAEPVTLKGSKQGTFTDMGVSDPLLSTDGLSVSLLSGEMNEILWIAESDIIVIGSAKQIRGIGPADLTQAFSATNLTQVDGPLVGASAIQPAKMAENLFFVEKGGAGIRQIGRAQDGRIIAPLISRISEHFFRGRILEWAQTNTPSPRIYIVTEDGRLVCFTYDQFEQVVAFAEIVTDGVFESVAAVSGRDDRSDDVYMIVRRTINGQEKRYIEVLENQDYLTDETDAFHLDCALTYEGAATSTITGLDHLEGRTVTAFTGNSAYTGLVVTGGSITLPVEVTKVHVGLDFTSRLVTMPISGPSQDGSLFGRSMRVTAVTADLYNAGPVKAGQYRATGERLDVINPKSSGTIASGAHQRDEGYHKTRIDGSWREGDGSVVVQVNNPFPCVVRALAFQFEATP